MPSRIPSSLTPSSSTSSSASSSFVPYSAFTASARGDPLALHNTNNTSTATGVHTLSDLALRDTRSQSLGSSLSSSRDEYEHLSYTPIYPSYSSSFSNSSLEFHESLLLAIRERQQQLNRMRAADASSSTTNPPIPSNIAGDFHPSTQRPSIASDALLEQDQDPLGESQLQRSDIHSDTPVALTNASASASASSDDQLSRIQDPSHTSQPSLEGLASSFHDAFSGAHDDQSHINGLSTSLMRSRAFSDLGPHPEPPFQPLLLREGPSLTNDTQPSATTTTTTSNLPAAPRGPARRRYTTRDYSSGPLSANDWLRHPDVVSFSSLSTAPSEPITGESQGTLDPNTPPSTHENHENQENIPPPPHLDAIPGTTHSTRPDFDIGFPPPTITPRDPRVPTLSSDHTEEQAQTEDRLAQDHNSVIRMFETLGVTPAQQATMDPEDLSTPQPLVNTNHDRGPPPPRQTRSSNRRDDIAACFDFFGEQSFGSSRFIRTSFVRHRTSSHHSFYRTIRLCSPGIIASWTQLVHPFHGLSNTSS